MKVLNIVNKKLIFGGGCNLSINNNINKDYERLVLLLVTS